MATAVFLRSDRRRYSKLILSLNNYYKNHQKKYPKTLTDIYGLMVTVESTRPKSVSRGRNKDMHFGNVAVKPRTGVGVGIIVAAA